MPETTENNRLGEIYNYSNVLKGDTWKPKTIVVLDKNQQPVDLSQSTTILEIFKNARSQAPEIVLTEGNGLTLLGEAHNKIAIEQKIDLAPFGYFYRLKSTLSSGFVVTSRTGIIQVTSS